MAKKDLNEDILSGGSISGSEKKKKSVSKAAMSEKKAKESLKRELSLKRDKRAQR